MADDVDGRYAALAGHDDAAWRPIPARYMRLDLDWLQDEKMVLYRQRHGRASPLDALAVFMAVIEGGGRLDMGDALQRAFMVSRTGMRGKRLDRVLSGMAEVGLVNPVLHGAGVVTSERMQAEADLIRARYRRTRAATQARWGRGSGGGEPARG